MFKDFIGKDVELIVGFSTYTVDGGASPVVYQGKLLDTTNDSIKVSLVKRGNGKLNSFDYHGELMEINIKYVISIRELV